MNDRRIAQIVTAVASCTLIATAAIAAGSVTGVAAKATRGFPSVVMFSSPEVDTPVPTEAVVMTQLGKKYLPGVLVARVGQTVTFRNEEDMLHNVHGFNYASGDTMFNIAQPIYGMQMDFVFKEAGTYAILCDVHPEMEGYVVVTDAPYAAVAEADGTFVIDLPPGEYQLRVWNIAERKHSTKKVSVGAAGFERIS